MFSKGPYGSARTSSCFFCEKPTTTESEEGMPACSDHSKEKLPDKRCACGSSLDIKKSKFGAFFVCMNCGPVSLSKMKRMGEETGGGYHLNKKFRDAEKKKIEYDRERLYTMDELVKLWDEKEK
jgi:hypothetical protein